MRNVNSIAVEMGLLSAGVRNLCLDTFTRLTNEFKSTSTSNKQTILEANMQTAMVDYAMYSQLNSEYKRKVDESKKRLDDTLSDMGIESDVEAGTSKVLYSDSLYTYTKKRNVDSVQVSAKDLATQLAVLGVEKDIIDKAIDKANKTRRGNTYYNISET